MADLIRRADAIRETWKEPTYSDPLNVLTEMRDRLEALPSAEPEWEKGKWLMHSDVPVRLICSECGAQFDVWHWESKQMHFCPNCGEPFDVR